MDIFCDNINGAQVQLNFFILSISKYWRSSNLQSVCGILGGHPVTSLYVYTKEVK